MNVKDYLKDKGIAFEVLPHPRIKGSARQAESLHVPGAQFAKTVLLHVNHGFGDVVVVVPAHRQVDPEKVSKLLGNASVCLGAERDVAVRCPDCESGVLSPFGSQYAMKTVVDASLAAQSSIVFEGNSYDEAIRIQWSDFERVENPLVGELQRSEPQATDK